MENQHAMATENNIIDNTFSYYEGAIIFTPTVTESRYPAPVIDYASLYPVLHEEDLMRHPLQVDTEVLPFDLYQRITEKKVSMIERYIKAIKNYIQSQNLILTPKLAEQIYTHPETTEQFKKVFPNLLCMYWKLNSKQNLCWFEPAEKTNGFECPICFEKIELKPNKIIELAKCEHKLCARCFIRVKTHTNIVCPLCRKISKSYYPIYSTGELEEKFNSQVELFEMALGQVEKELWGVESDVNFNSDIFYKLLLEANLLFDEFAKTPVKINPQILTNIENFIGLEIPDKSGTELIMKKLMSLRLSREDFHDITFYKTCLDLGWICQ